MTVQKRPANVVGPQVQKRRYDLGLSQEQLAVKCQIAGFDISCVSLAQIEAQLRWVKDWEIMQLAQILKVPIEKLFPISQKLRKQPRKKAK